MFINISDVEFQVTITEQGSKNTNSTEYIYLDLLEEDMEEDWDLEEEQSLLEMVQKRIEEGEIETQDAKSALIVVLHKETPEERLPCGKICQLWKWLKHPMVGDTYLWYWD